MEKNIAESLFGRAREIGSDINHPGVKPEEILAPFKEKDSVARMFCENCEGHYEISQEIVDKLLSPITSKNELKKGEYISTDGCTVCKKERTDVSVKKIEIH